MSDLTPSELTPPEAPLLETPAPEAHPTGPAPTGFEPTQFFTTPPQPEPLFATYTAPEPVHRIPHIGHALLFTVMSASILLASAVALVLIHHPHNTQQAAAIAQQPSVAVLSELIGYILTLIAAALVFPLLWDRSFASGIEWNPSPALRLAPRIIPFGLLLGFLVEAINSRLPQPKSMPIDNFFRHPSDVWLITLFGTLLAPAFEEILFRGFLLPAFAIAWDWVTLQRTPESITQWDASNTLSPPALAISAVITSLLFIWLHSAQLAGSHSALATLFAVSLVFTYMRIKFRSVAVSALLHSSYNLSVFLMLFAATGGYRHLDRLTH